MNYFSATMRDEEYQNLTPSIYIYIPRALVIMADYIFLDKISHPSSYNVMLTLLLWCRIFVLLNLTFLWKQQKKMLLDFHR